MIRAFYTGKGNSKDGASSEKYIKVKPKIYGLNYETPWQCNGVGSLQLDSGPGWFVLSF